MNPDSLRYSLGYSSSKKAIRLKMPFSANSFLRSLGYIEGTDRLTDKAFAAFFSTFDTITCPDEIQRCMDELRITGIQWRRAKGVILQRIRHGHGHGMTFPLAMTIFVRDGAALPTWYHELGHITFQSIKEDRGSIARLLASAMASFPVKSSSEVKDAPGIAEGYLFTGLKPNRIWPSNKGLNKSPRFV